MRLVRAALCSALLAPSPSAAPQADTGGEPAARRIERGREALEAGRAAEAVHHLEGALAFEPHSSEVLELLVRAARGDADARALWAAALRLAAADARGRASLPRGLVDELREAAPELEELVEARFEAALELLSFAATRQKRARSRPDQALVAWWARELARRLARPAPALAERADEGPGHGIEAPSKLAADVARELRRGLAGALSGGRTGEAVRFGRLLAGLGNQASSEKLQGDAPAGARALEEVGRDGLRRARERLAGELGEPLTVEALEELDSLEQLAFTRAHADFANPGLAVSPDAFYRVETICGYETLYGAASTVEHHHRRLARWYGTDPFAERQGLVRVDPEAAGLESESTPFWWAGGFQSGDLTVLRFSCGTIAGLGRGLTHELTHRFDGALFPGMPSWLAEGRAVWTGHAYTYVESEEFVADALSVGTVESAFIKGYGAERKLRELIDGSIEDYRDNYVAGYALYVYLDTWRGTGGEPLFAARLPEYMSALARYRGDPVSLFEEHFADGRAGRPEDLGAFAEGFGEFLRGCYWQSRADWVEERYVTDVGGEPASLVLDEPSWTWARRRAEPFYGDEHAWRAGELLAELGREDEAIDAFVWALSVDERALWRVRALAELLAREGRADAAWVLANDLVRHRRSPAEAGDAAPILDELPRTRALVAAFDEAARVAREAGREASADRWLGERDVLAAALGLPLSSTAPSGAAMTLHPVHEPWRQLGRSSWEDAGLTGYEERRVVGLWYAEENGDLHVGRERPRQGTGTLDRASHQRDAFALATDWMQPGRYRVRCRVQFTTSFVNGALVLGWTRRDRNLRVHFSAGDFLYAIGGKEEAAELAGVRWRLDGLREREPPLSGSLAGGEETFDAPRAHFALEVMVDGGRAELWIEGRQVATYHTPDGSPIEGRVGFATGMGAVRVIAPEVQRLDATWRLDPDEASSAGPAERAQLDLSAPPEADLDELLNRPVLGLQPSPRGTLLLWLALPEVDEAGDEPDIEASLDRGARFARNAERLLSRYDASSPIVVAAPAALGEEALARLDAELEELRPEGVTLAVYPGAPLVYDPGAELPGSARDWLLFVDAAGVLRFAARAYGYMEVVPEPLARWISVLREHRG